MTPSLPTALPLPPTTTAPRADVEYPRWISAWQRMVPLWRYAAYGLAFFVALAALVSIRVDVRALEGDLHANAGLVSEALLQNERLHLEVRTRRRAVQLEREAAALALVADVAHAEAELAR